MTTALTNKLTGKRIDSIDQGSYLTPGTHTTRAHHTTIKAGGTQIRFDRLPTQPTGGNIDNTLTITGEDTKALNGITITHQKTPPKRPSTTH